MQSLKIKVGGSLKTLLQIKTDFKKFVDEDNIAEIMATFADIAIVDDSLPCEVKNFLLLDLLGTIRKAHKKKTSDFDILNS